MPSCVAIGCHRRKDAILKVFPRKDRRRRQIWVERVNRPGWSPTKSSALCERHFDRDQWELPREDGKLKLKDTAVPTVFLVPPSDDGGVYRDHPYSLPLYRKIYDDGDSKADTQEEKDEEVLPIEHIKVESDENDKLAVEPMEEEEEEGERREVENIQCTPDISVFPERGEPFPIEMVECESGDVNTVTSDPDSDPLAISAEDHVKAASMKPYFGNSKKFLFIPKKTKIMVNAPSKAQGEPEVKNVDGITNSNTGNSDSTTAQPMLKVKSLEGLLDPNKLKPLSNVANLDSKTVLRSPSAVYIKEKLTLSDESDQSRKEAVKLPPSKKKLIIDQKVVTLTSPKFNFPPKLNVVSSTGDSVPKLNVVSQKLKETIVIPPRPNILIPKSDERKVERVSDPKANSLKQMMTNTNTQSLLTPLIPNKQEHNTIEKLSAKNTPLNSMKPVGLKKFLYGTQHRSNSTIEQDMENTLSKNSNGKPIGNNSVRAWLDSNISDGYRINDSNLKVLQNSKNPNTKQSVILLKPFGSYNSIVIDNSGISSRSFLGKDNSLSKKSFTVYKCDMCQITFTSPFALSLHKKKAGHLKKEAHHKIGDKVMRDNDQNDDAEEIIIRDTSESSSDYIDSESEDSSVVELDTSDDESESDPPEETYDNNDSIRTDSETETATEEGEEFGVFGKDIVKQGNINTDMKSLIKIPSNSALGNSKKHEFIRLSDFNSQVSSDTTDPNVIYVKKRLTSTNPPKLIPILGKFADEGPSAPEVKLMKENLLNRVSTKSVLLMGRKDPSNDKSQNGSKLMDNSDGKEIIMLSNSSSTSNKFSRQPRSSAVDDSDGEEEIVLSDSSSTSSKFISKPISATVDDSFDELSSIADISSNLQRTQSLTYSNISIDSIEKISSMKEQVEFNSSVSNQTEKLGSLRTNKVENNLKKPIVLLQRLDPKILSQFKKSSNSDLDSSVLRVEENSNNKQPVSESKRNEKFSSVLNTGANHDEIQEELSVLNNERKGEQTSSKLSHHFKRKRKEESDVSPQVLELDKVKTRNTDKMQNTKNSSANSHPESLHREVEIVQNKTVFVRRSGRSSCYEKYKNAKKISQYNMKLNSKRKRLEENEACRRSSSLLKTKKTKLMMKKVNESKGCDTIRRPPKFETKTCQLCGDNIHKSKFKLHVLQHIEKTSACKVCNEKFPHHVLLRRHMKKEHYL